MIRALFRLRKPYAPAAWTGKATVARRWEDFRAGLAFGFPLCCVVRFALSRQWKQAKTRGIVFLPTFNTEGWPDTYVPCDLFHRSRYRSEGSVLAEGLVRYLEHRVAP